MSVTVPPPTPVPPPGYWPMPPPMGAMPGCGPPSNSLMDCYWSVQSATAFISTLMIDAINNNPAVAEAMIDAIEKSGSALPLIGVTDGSNAQPGQVGEWVRFQTAQTYGTTQSTQTITSGILQPGDWDVVSFMLFSTYIGGAQYIQTPVPAGFTDPMFAATETVSGAVGLVLISNQARASITVPSLITFSAIFNGVNTIPSGGTAQLIVQARRMR